MSVVEQMIRRLVLLAYEQGWRDACDDHLQQRGTREQAADETHPIGARHKAAVDDVLAVVDPTNLFDLRERRY